MHESLYTLTPLLEPEAHPAPEPVPQPRPRNPSRRGRDSQGDELCDPREFRARWWPARDSD